MQITATPAAETSAFTRNVAGELLPPARKTVHVFARHFYGLDRYSGGYVERTRLTDDAAGKRFVANVHGHVAGTWEGEFCTYVLTPVPMAEVDAGLKARFAAKAVAA
jgi:hypothetical protein